MNIIPENDDQENKYKRKKSKNNDLSNDKSYNNLDKRNITTEGSENKKLSRSKSNKNKKKSNSKENNINNNNNGERENNLTKKENKEYINDIYITNKFLKDINLDKYPYNRVTVKKIKLIFRNFFDNRKKYLSESKANYKKDINKMLTTENENENEPQYFKNKNPVYYNELKNKIFNQYKNELTFKPDNTSQTYNQSHLTEKRKTLKMEDAYQYQKKKKEK